MWNFADMLVRRSPEIEREAKGRLKQLYSRFERLRI
jgi:hypothetical protein